MPQVDPSPEFGRVPDLRIDYQQELNEQQYAAVTAPPGPALVLAGAGSGKTRTLTYRVAYLIEQGIQPDRILLLTFTNKAAREMMHRVSGLLGCELRALWGGTFHSIGARILRAYGQSIGCSQNFTIMDTADAEDLVASCVLESGVDRKAREFPKTEALLELFSQSANRRVQLHDWLEQRGFGDTPYHAEILKIHALYKARKMGAQLLDFDDLLVLWLQLLEQDTHVCELLQRRFQFILVDEYQDTNRIQADIIDLLARRSGNLMVVGDDSQSIYSWRGANLRNIIDFPARYPSAAVFKIEYNYRSTPEILALANRAISVNEEQFPKTLRPSLGSGSPPVVAACIDARQQAAFVARQIQEHFKDGVPPNEIAVLYRSHFHALELQLELTRSQIPYSITSGIRFFEQAHIKDVAAFLKLAANHSDEVSFRRIAKMLPGVGEKSAQKIWMEFSRQIRALPQNDAASLPKAFQQCLPALPQKSRPSWTSWAVTLSRFVKGQEFRPPADLIQEILDGGYQELLRLAYDSAERRLDDIEQMQRLASEFQVLPEFLTQLSLLSAADSEETRSTSGEDPVQRVHLSTIHQAKGLEFDVVFVVMLCEGLFPSRRSAETPGGVEEERRLFYVGVTRAKHQLYLSFPLGRSFHQGGDNEMLTSSRFVEEVRGESVEEWNLFSNRYSGGWS